MIQGANSTRHYGYSPCRKTSPGQFDVHDPTNTKNFAKFNSYEPLDRSVHPVEDIATKISPFTNKVPASKGFKSGDLRLAKDLITDLNANQKTEGKRVTLNQVLTRLNAANIASKKTFDQTFASARSISPGTQTSLTSAKKSKTAFKRKLTFHEKNPKFAIARQDANKVSE